MLGSAAVSTGCCLAPGAGASRGARTLAAAMLAVMSAVALGAGPAVRYPGVLLLLALAMALVADDPPERGRLAEWHRAAGAALMALAVLTHLYGGSMAAHHLAAMPGTGHGTAAGHGTSLVPLVHAATAAYLCWTAVALVRPRNPRSAGLHRAEQLAMAASLTTMAFFMG